MQLQPPRIGVNSAFSSQFILARLVLGAYGVKEDAQLPLFTAANLAAALTNGTVDAVFVTANYPAQSVAAAAAAGAHLLPMDDTVAERLRRRYPFVHRVSIPARTYVGQERIGPHDWRRPAAGVPERSRRCARARAHAALHRGTAGDLFRPLRASARLMNLDSASATPIPLHPGAAQYYRERELAP
ncbi:MAG: TAXI family TRAP transporter solute-binding subunit [Vicinamibacterales bacterium]